MARKPPTFNPVPRDREEWATDDATGRRHSDVRSESFTEIGERFGLLHRNVMTPSLGSSLAHGVLIGASGQRSLAATNFCVSR